MTATFQHPPRGVSPSAAETFASRGRLLRVIPVEPHDASASKVPVRNCVSVAAHPKVRVRPKVHVPDEVHGGQELGTSCSSLEGDSARFPPTSLTCGSGRFSAWAAAMNGATAANRATASLACLAGSTGSTAAADDGMITVGSIGRRGAAARAGSQDLPCCVGNSRSRGSSAGRSGRAAPEVSSLEESLISDIQALLATVLGASGSLPPVEPRAAQRGRFGPGAILNSYGLLKALRDRDCRDLARVARGGDPLVGVLLMLRNEFHRGAGLDDSPVREPMSARSGSRSPSPMPRNSSSAHFRLSSWASRVRSLSPPRARSPSVAQHRLSSWLRTSGGTLRENSPAVATAVVKETNDCALPGSPWEDCEVLADEDMIDFLAESSKWWPHCADAATPMDHSGAVLMGISGNALKANRWEASTDVGSISTQSSISRGVSDSIVSRTSSAPPSEEPGSRPGPSTGELGGFPGLTCSADGGLQGFAPPFDTCAEESPDEAELDDGWEQEFAERIRLSME